MEKKLEQAPHVKGDLIVGNKVGNDESSSDKIQAIIPYKQRFNHTLVIGDEDSNIESNFLVPQLNRDIQNDSLGIIVLSSMDDLPEQAYALAQYHNREDIVYFDPALLEGLHINPLSGTTQRAINTVLSSLLSVVDNPVGTQLIHYATQVIKSIEYDSEFKDILYGDGATLIDLSNLIHNTDAQGIRMIEVYQQTATSDEDIARWFLEDYFTGSVNTDTEAQTTTFEQTVTIRNELVKLVINPHLRNLLNPPKAAQNIINLSYLIEKGYVIILATGSTWLHDAGLVLNRIIVSCIQQAVRAVPKSEKHTMVYINGLLAFINDDFEEMLEDGHEFNIAYHIITQAMDDVSESERVSPYIDNYIVFGNTLASDSGTDNSFSGFNEVIYKIGDDSHGVAIPKWIPMTLRYDLDLIIEDIYINGGDINE